MPEWAPRCKHSCMREEAHIFGADTNALPELIGEPSSAPQYRVFHHFRQFDREARKWNLLDQDCSLPSHDYAWLSSCAEILAVNQRLHMLTVGGTQPTALAPLIEHGRLCRRIETIGVDEFREPTEFPHKDPAALQELAAALAKLGLPIYLKRVRASSPIIPALRKAFGRCGVVTTQQVSAYPWLRLDTSWLNPDQNLSASSRSSLRGARRNAERIGPVTFEIHNPSHSELEPLLEEAGRVEASGGGNASALLLPGDRAAFLERYSSAIRPKGGLRLCFMRINGRAVAAQIAVESGNRLWLLKVGYDEEYAHCSPGHVLMEETIRCAAQRQLASVEFLGSAATWTAMWTTSFRRCVAVWAYPPTLKGFTRMGYDGVTGLCQLLRNAFQ